MSGKSWSLKKRRDIGKSKFKVMGNHDEFLSRIKKTLYYGKLPLTERFSFPVSELAAEIFSDIKNRPSLERLDLEDAAVISRNACVSPCSLVLAIIYLERLKKCNQEYLQKVIPSELFLVSMMVASKFLHDDGEDDEVFNDEWAKSAGIDVKEINNIERHFLHAIDWKVFVSQQAFWEKLVGLEQDIAFREGNRRGWFSYTDMDKLIETVNLASMAQALIVVSAVCIASYTVSVLTLFGSAFIVSHVPGTSMSHSRLNPSTSLKSNESIQSPPTTHEISEDITSNEGFILSSINSCNGNETDSVLVPSQNSWSYFVYDWISKHWQFLSLEGDPFVLIEEDGNRSEKGIDFQWYKESHRDPLREWIPYVTKWLKHSSNRWMPSPNLFTFEISSHY